MCEMKLAVPARAPFQEESAEFLLSLSSPNATNQARFAEKPGVLPCRSGALRQDRAGPASSQPWRRAEEWASAGLQSLRDAEMAELLSPPILGETAASHPLQAAANGRCWASRAA